MNNVWLWACFGVFATIPFIPLLLRNRSAMAASRRFSKLAQAFLQEATHRGIQANKHVVIVHDSFVGAAALAPYIATGMVIPQHEKNRETLTAWRAFLDENAWVLGFTSAAYFQFRVLEYMASPWSLPLLGKAIAAKAMLACCSEESGALTISLNSEQTAESFSSDSEAIRCGRVAFG